MESPKVRNPKSETGTRKLPLQETITRLGIYLLLGGTSLVFVVD